MKVRQITRYRETRWGQRGEEPGASKFGIQDVSLFKWRQEPVLQKRPGKGEAKTGEGIATVPSPRPKTILNISDLFENSSKAEWHLDEVTQKRGQRPVQVPLQPPTHLGQPERGNKFWGCTKPTKPKGTAHSDGEHQQRIETCKTGGTATGRRRDSFPGGREDGGGHP